LSDKHRLEVEPDTQVNSSSARIEASKTTAPAAAVGFPKVRRSQRAVEISLVLVIEYVKGVDAECQIVLVAITETPGAAHHHHGAASSSSTHYHLAAPLRLSRGARAPATSAVAAALTTPTAGGVTPTSTALIFCLSATLLPTLSVLPTAIRGGHPGKVIRRRTKTETPRYTEVHGDRPGSLPEVARDYFIAGEREGIECAEAGYDSTRIAGIRKRRPIEKLIVPIVIPTGGDVKRASAPKVEVGH
jgi:hypothetical protein